MTTDKTIKSKYQPKQTNVTWVDLSGETPVEKHFINGRWQAVGGGGSGSGSDYQSSGSIVKDMIEQGTNFNWAKYVIDLSALPCFKPEAEWPQQAEVGDLLADGYVAVSLTVSRTRHTFVVKQTGDNPSVSIGSFGPVFTDCKPVTVEPSMPMDMVPAIVIMDNPPSYVPIFGGFDGAWVYPMILGTNEADVKGYVGNVVHLVG